MQLEKIYKDELIKELRFIAKKINEEPNLEKKIFFFSATYGVTSRIMKMSFQRELLLSDFIFTQTHQLMAERFNQIKKGETVIPMEEHVFKKIAIKIAQMADRIEKNEPFYDIIELILTIGFSLNGPGHYLSLKGQLTLD